MAAAGVGVVFQTAAGVVSAVVFQIDCLLQEHQTEDSYQDHEAATEIFEGSVGPQHYQERQTLEGLVMAEAKQVVESEDIVVEEKQKFPEIVVVHVAQQYQMLQPAAAAYTSGAFAFDGEQIRPAVPQWHDLGLGSGDEDAANCQAHATDVASDAAEKDGLGTPEQELSGCW